MKAVDFEYDGQHLSDYDFIICDFDGSSGANTVDIGAKISFNKSPIFQGKKHVLLSSEYEDCVSAEFDICKDPEVYDDLEITSDEFRDLMRWLNRRRFHELCIFDQDEDYESVYFNASFNIEKIKIGEKTCGLRLSMETDSPFAHGAEQKFRHTFSNSSDEYVVSDLSDDIGYIYPVLTIKCMADGDITVSNTTFECSCTINNCENGETIVIDGNALSIATDNETHNIYNDFNYEFFIIGNSINNRKNRITVSAQCEIEIRFSPIIKDLP